MIPITRTEDYNKETDSYDIKYYWYDHLKIKRSADNCVDLINQLEEEVKRLEHLFEDAEQFNLMLE